MVSDLPKTDQTEVLMEFNSHIYESVTGQSDGTELDRLMDVLDKLGSPEEVLAPLIAEKKLNQATSTFNPVHVFKAIALNIGNGIAYTIFAFMYLLLGAFIFCIGAKVVNPSEVGLFFKDGHFQCLGAVDQSYIDTSQLTEVLGHWFIPVMIIVSILWYLLITVLLRMLRKKK